MSEKARLAHGWFLAGLSVARVAELLDMTPVDVVAVWRAWVATSEVPRDERHIVEAWIEATMLPAAPTLGRTRTWRKRRRLRRLMRRWADGR